MVLGRYKEKGLWALLFPQAKSMGEIRRENFIFLKFHLLVSQFFFPSRIYGGVLKNPQAMECHSIFIPKRILDSLALKTFWCGKAKISQHWIYLVTRVANPEKLNAPQDFKTVALFLHALTGTTFEKKNHKKSQKLKPSISCFRLVSALFSEHCFGKF